MKSVTRKSLLAVALVVGLALPGSVLAGQILTFEGFASETILTTQYAGINFQGATILTEGVSLNPPFPPHSGVNVVYNPVGPMQLVFSTPIEYFSGYVTYNSGMTINGYDALNNLIDTATGAWSSNYIGSGGTPNELLTINGSNIVKVVLTGGAGNNFTLDDASFTGSINRPVPLPGAVVLLGSGLAGFFGWSRRKKLHRFRSNPSIEEAGVEPNGPTPASAAASTRSFLRLRTSGTGRRRVEKTSLPGQTRYRPGGRA